jgi:hypothetical protein
LHLETHQESNGSVSDLSTVAVVGNKVGAAIESTGDTAGSAESLDSVGDGSRGTEALENLEVKSETRNVGGGHGSTVDGAGGSIGADPSGLDCNTRSVDINTGACLHK